MMFDYFLIMGLGTPEMIIITIVGLLLFGKRLPEVGRSVGKSFFELKRGLGDIKREMEEVEELTDRAADEYRYSKPVERGDDKGEVIRDVQPFDPRAHADDVDPAARDAEKERRDGDPT